jgi:hypothetical protein
MRGAHAQAIEPFHPLFNYFVVLRNCIAHQSGRANATLVELDAGEDLKKSLPGMPTVSGAVLLITDHYGALRRRLFLIGHENGYKYLAALSDTTVNACSTT